MKNTMKKMAVAASTTMGSLIMGMTPVLAATNGKKADFSTVANPIISLINSILGPALGIVGAVGLLYCIVLGVKFAKAEDPQEHEKAKNHLKNAIIGYVLIFVLMFALKVGTGIMTSWVEANAKGTSPAIDLDLSGQ